MPNPLRIQIVGGLGNQIHGLFAAYVLNSELNRDIILDGRWLSWTGSNGNRKFNLEGITLSDNFTPEIRKSVPAIKRGPLRRKISTFISAREKDSYLNSVSSDAFQSAESLLFFLMSNPEINSITGHFATWDWAEMAISKPDFRWKVVPNHSRYLIELIDQTQKVIGVHVRLGDYLHHPDIYPLPPEKYFLDAIEMFRDAKYTEYWIHTDDVPNLHKMYPNLVANAKEIIGPNQFTELQSLELLSGHDRLVIANSTFSSWAAFVSSLHQGTKVICPERYLVGSFKDTRPINWIRG